MAIAKTSVNDPRIDCFGQQLIRVNNEQGRSVRGVCVYDEGGHKVHLRFVRRTTGKAADLVEQDGIVDLGCCHGNTEPYAKQEQLLIRRGNTPGTRNYSRDVFDPSASD